MSNLTPNQTELQNAWQAVYKGAGLGLDWIAEVAPKVAEVADKAERLNRDLYRARNLARSLARVSTTPMGIGFFGLSQAGKSYLISALAADSEGSLHSEMGHETLDFLKHVNPVGGGKEATGLVTRFTRISRPAPDSAFPVELRLFREVELAIILANAWFEDFDPQRRDPITSERVQETLQPFAGRAHSAGQPGLSRDDVVALWDYLERNYPRSVEVLAAEYWPTVLQLAPRLSPDERGQLFSVLWGGIPEMTATYRQLASCLHRLGLADTLFAPIEALVNRQGDELRQTNSIMNVDILSRLGSGQDTSLQVRPLIDGQLAAPCSVQAAELAALTNELIFRLKSTPANDLVNSVDLLDFPGYRSRQKLARLEEAGEVNSDGQPGNPVAKLLLRGKVAYLFERYTIEQEMNALVMCTSTFKQSEVVSVGPVLKSWIDNTQGPTPQHRDGRPSGLVWALTMCDGFIINALQAGPSLFAEACDNMLKLTMMERFGKEDWMQQWDSQPFRNTYLVRKPRFKAFFLNLDSQENETGFQSESEANLNLLGETFANSELARRHVAQPAAAWQAMLTLNDGGMTRFSQALVPVSDINFKLGRIREQLNELLDQLLPRLDAYYEPGGEDERARKKELANKIVGPFVKQSRHQVLGELLAALALPDEQLRQLYLSGDFESGYEADSAPAAAAASAPAADFDIWGSDDSEPAAAPAAAATPALQSHEHRFARAAFELWVSHLRQLPRRLPLLDLLGLQPDVISALVNEMIITAERLDLPAQLSKALLRRSQTGVRHDAMVQRQVLTCQLVLNDFAAWFGHMSEPKNERPNGLLGTKTPLFSFYQSSQEQRFPALPEQAIDQTVLFAYDWFSGVAIHTQNNSGHRKGREITPEQNEQLGLVIKAFNKG